MQYSVTQRGEKILFDLLNDDLYSLGVCFCVYLKETLSRSLHGSECTTHDALSDLLTVKPLFALADSCVEMDWNENESAACAKGQRVCLCSPVVEEVKEPF